MENAGVVDKVVCTPIEWKDNSCNPTLKKQKKKKGGKNVNITTSIPSFFNFFEDVNPEDDKWKSKKEGENEDDEHDDDVGGRLQEELDLSDQFKDDLVPLALEYYLGVIEKEEPEEEDSEGEGADDKKDDKKDEDEDEGKKKKKSKKGGAAGDQKEECKQQ